MEGAEIGATRKQGMTLAQPEKVSMGKRSSDSEDRWQEGSNRTLRKEAISRAEGHEKAYEVNTGGREGVRFAGLRVG